MQIFGGMQIVGFFIVEERVQAGCGEVGEGWQLTSGWEAALASLKTRLEAACSTLPDPDSLSKLKEFAVLSCTVLGMPAYCLTRLSVLCASPSHQQHTCSSLCPGTPVQQSLPRYSCAAICAQILLCSSLCPGTPMHSCCWRQPPFTQPYLQHRYQLSSMHSYAAA